MFIEFQDSGGPGEVATLGLFAVGQGVAERLEGLLKLSGESLAVRAEGGQETVCVNDVEIKGGLFAGRIGVPPSTGSRLN